LIRVIGDTFSSKKYQKGFFVKKITKNISS